MNCFLIGSKELSVKMLEELIKENFKIKGVLVRDSEQSMNVWLNELQHRSLKNKAEEYGIQVYENINVNSSQMIDILSEMDLDIIFSVFWGDIIKQTVLNIPRLGVFNLHTAYLPTIKM